MKKTNKIIYIIATGWMILGMVSTGIVQVLRVDKEVESIQQLGYPVYLLTLIGLWKLLGSIAILVPRFPILKEWAYAGFFFVMSGAAFSRIAAGDSISKIFPAILLLSLVLISWYFRPPLTGSIRKDSMTGQVVS